MADTREERAGRPYPMDNKDEKPEVLEAAAQKYYAKLLEQPSSAVEFFSVPEKEKVKLESSVMRFLPLFGEDSKRTLLVLNDPQRKDTVLAVYLHHSWWLVEDIVKTADLSREGLMQVQTFVERVVLFVLNYIIFGMQERSLTSDVFFMPHSEKEYAKIFWRSGEAAAFYTVKPKAAKMLVEMEVERQKLMDVGGITEEDYLHLDKFQGSLCDGHSWQCYLLPVLDTLFVRKKFRRRGLGAEVLRDFCQTFAGEEALGVSCPISADMYQVCQRFLDAHPEEQARLWEVEAPGDWSRHVSIWLKIQLEQNRPQKDDLRFQDDEPQQSGDSQMNKRVVQAPSINQEEEFSKDSGKPLDSQPEDHVSQQGGEGHPRGEPKERAKSREPNDDGVAKRRRVVS